MPTTTVQDVPAVSIGLTAESFKAVCKAYDLFTRSDDSSVAVLEAIAFGCDELEALVGIIGAEAAEECAGQYVFFHVCS